MMSTGAMMFGITGIIWMAAMFRGASAGGEGFVPLFLTGLGLMLGGLLPLPTWARTRDRQMEEIAERLSISVSRPALGLPDEQR
jgi:hypothetical protein